MLVRRSALLVLPLFAACGLMFLSSPGIAEKPLTARSVAGILDAIIQPRFSDDSGKLFGMSRLTSIIMGHRAVTLPSNVQVGPISPTEPSEKRQIDQIDTKHWRYFVGFLHMAHVPGKPADADPSFLTERFPRLKSGPKIWFSPLAMSDSTRYILHNDMETPVEDQFKNWDTSDRDPKEVEKLKQTIRQSVAMAKAWEQTAKERLPIVRKGHQVEVSQGEWTLFLRPIKAMKPSCVSCHAGSKQGDTLGVMVYAVSINR